MKIIKGLVYFSALLTILPFLRPRGLAARAWMWVGKPEPWLRPWASSAVWAAYWA
jgi:hypothetical protein